MKKPISLLLLLVLLSWCVPNALAQRSPHRRRSSIVGGIAGGGKGARHLHRRRTSSLGAGLGAGGGTPNLHRRRDLIGAGGAGTYGHRHRRPR